MQQCLNLLHANTQLTSSFGFGGLVVRKKAHFPKKCLLEQKRPNSVLTFILNASYAKNVLYGQDTWYVKSYMVCPSD